MEKKLGLLSVSLILGSLFGLVPLSTTNVEAASVIGSSVHEYSLIDQLKSTIEQATPFLDSTKYKEDAVNVLKNVIKLSQDAIDGNYAYDTLIPFQITAIKNAIELVKQSPNISI